MTDAFIDAIIKNDIERVREFLMQKMDPNICEDAAHITPLHFAAQNNAVESAQLLINAGADIHAATIDGMTPLDVAKLHGHQRMIKLLENTLRTSNDHPRIS